MDLACCRKAELGEEMIVPDSSPPPCDQTNDHSGSSLAALRLELLARTEEKFENSLAALRLELLARIEALEARVVLNSGSNDVARSKPRKIESPSPLAKAFEDPTSDSAYVVVSCARTETLRSLAADTIVLAENVYSDMVLALAQLELCSIFRSFLIFVIAITAELLFSINLVGQIAVNKQEDFVSAENADGDEYSIYAQWTNDRNDLGGGAVSMLNFTSRQLACSQSGWNWFVDKMGDMSDYAEPVNTMLTMPKGLLFGIVCEFLWMGAVIMETRRALNFASLIWLPRATPGVPDYSYSVEDGVGRLTSLRAPVKVAVFCMTIVWLVCNATLAYYGALFIAYTESLEDFVLNCIALAFIFDIKQMFFSTFLSGEKQMTLSTLEAPKIEGWVRQACWKIGNFDEVFILLLTVVAVAVGSVELVSFANMYIDDAYTVICPQGASGRGSSAAKQEF